jgi:hypothetical protein
MSSDKPASPQPAVSRIGPPREPRLPTPQVPPARGTRAWIERFGPWLGLLALCLALYLPGLATLPPTDRDEARFAQASRQMAASGDLVRIQFQSEPRNKKPILIYWAQAASAALSGEAPVEGRPAILPYRLPSALGASIAVLLLFAIARRLLEPRAAFIAASLLGCALITVVEAHIATTDAALLASCVASLGALALIYTGAARGRGTALMFWIGLGLGILIKGPIVPLVAALTVRSPGCAICMRHGACRLPCSSWRPGWWRSSPRPAAAFSPMRSARTCCRNWSAARNRTAHSPAPIRCW